MSALATAKTQNDLLIDRLIDRLNAGEVIPDEDLVGIKLRDENGSIKQLSKIIVASAGKPGQGVLTRIDPGFFEAKDDEMLGEQLEGVWDDGSSDPSYWMLGIDTEMYDLFPVNGNFNFKNAVESLIALIARIPDGRNGPNDRRQVLQIYFGFWLYHGTEAMYRRLWRENQQILAEIEFGAKGDEVQTPNVMYWAATEDQWDRFKRYKAIRSNVYINYSPEGTFAPVYIVKQTLGNLPSAYHRMLSAFNKSKKMYVPGKKGPQPKGSIKDLVDATIGLISSLNGTNLEFFEFAYFPPRIFRQIQIGLKEFGEFNPESLKWLSETEIVKNITSTDIFVSKAVEELDANFLIAITPAIWEKLSESIREQYRELLEESQKQTREKIIGVVLAMHGTMPSDTIVMTIMMSLPWERVWIGIGGKREYGKMASSVEVYIRKVIDSADKVKGEKEEHGDTTLCTTQASPMTTEEIVAKLKKVFKLSYEL